jgi:hypothetical protein
MQEEFLTLFEKDRGYTFTRSAAGFTPQDVVELAKKAAAIARAEGIDLADAAERVAPNVWDEAANHHTCTYDLRKAIVRAIKASGRKAK